MFRLARQHLPWSFVRDGISGVARPAASRKKEALRAELDQAEAEVEAIKHKFEDRGVGIRCGKATIMRDERRRFEIDEPIWTAQYRVAVGRRDRLRQELESSTLSLQERLNEVEATVNGLEKRFRDWEQGMNCGKATIERDEKRRYLTAKPTLTVEYEAALTERARLRRQLGIVEPPPVKPVRYGWE